MAPPRVVKPSRIKSQTGSPLVRKEKSSRNARSKRIIEVSQDNEQSVLAETEKPKRDSWLDHLPPVIKPDEELHITLNKARKEKQKIKHYDFCRSELSAILNYSFFSLKNQEDPKIIRKGRISFQIGKFHEDQSEFMEQKESNSKIISPYLSRIKFTPKYLLKEFEMGYEESIQELYRVFGSEGLDINHSFDNFLKKTDIGKLKYCETDNGNHKYQIPGILSIIGGSCSGKSTIYQFIQAHYDVKVIKVCSESPLYEVESKDLVLIIGNDEKIISQSVSEAILSTPPEQGIILVDYPLSKNQMVFLERLCQTQIKNRNIPKSGIHGAIISTISPDEALMQSSKRYVDKSTGQVFHQDFYPSSYLGSNRYPLPEEYMAEYPCNTEVSIASNKLHSTVLSIEKSYKKSGIPVLSVGLLEFAGLLFSSIESYLSSLFSISIPKSNVKFQTKKELLYSKFCYDISYIWRYFCYPQFGGPIGNVYSKIVSIKKSVPVLEAHAKDKFILLINQDDNRIDEVHKFLNNSSNPISFFNTIWTQSNEMRFKWLSYIDDILLSSGLSSLYEALLGIEDEIFNALVRRFLIVRWYSESFRDIINENTQKIPEELPMLIIPDYDINDLQSLTRIFRIQSIDQSNHIRLNNSYMKTPDEPPRKEIIEKFMRSIQTSFQDSILNDEMTTISRVYNYLVSEIERIEDSIDQNKLRDIFKSIAEKKFANEMEQFSSTFLQYKKEKDMKSITLFKYDRSSLNPQLYESLVIIGNRMPSIRKINHISEQNLINLLISIEQPIVSLDRILSSAKEAGFTKEAIAEIELIIRMSDFPSAVDLPWLCLSLSPSLTNEKQIITHLSRPQSAVERAGTL